MRKILLLISTVFTSLPILASEIATVLPSDKSGYAYASGLAIAIAASFCALAQAIVGKASIEGSARNPAAGNEIFVRTIVILALIESLAIYAFVIALMIKP